MNAISKNLAEEYAAAITDYLMGRGEAALQRAYEAGRRGLAEGLGVLEMVAAHQSAVNGVLRSQSGEQEKERTIERALSCFAESLSPFEMVLRGVQESNARLKQSLDSIKRVEDQLRRQNEKLTIAHEAVEKERYRYETLFDFAPDGYLVTGPEGAIREANTAAATLLETQKELLPGQSLAEFVVAADREAFREQLHILHTGTVDRVEDWQVSIQPRMGPQIPVALTVVAERGAPAAAGLRWLIRDVTERKRLELERARALVDHAKAEAARRFEFLAEASSLLVGSLDVEAALSKVAQLSVSYLATWCFVNVVDPDGSYRQLEVAHAEAASAALSRELNAHCLFGGGSPMDPDGGKIAAKARVISKVNANWYKGISDSPAHAELLGRIGGQSAMVVPLRFHGRIMGILTFISGPSGRRYRASDLALVQDLARRCVLAIENAHLYREVTAARDKAEKASRAKDEFFAILSHELRNPLMPVIGWSRILKNHRLIQQDTVLSEGVSSLERNAQTLARLVGDCLDLARISEGKIQLEQATVGLNQIVLASVDAVREIANAKHLKLTTELAPGSVPILGDPVRLEQVVMNLLVNAVKYTNEGGVIVVHTVPVGSEVELAVHDTGIGIDPAHLDQIFRPFTQGSSSWLTSQTGLGLGLAIAHHIVGMHGGRIWAESKGINCGSTFRVRLPIGATTAHSSVRSRRGLEEVRPGQAMRILLVEDSQDVLFLIKVELERLGHDVRTALDGSSGLQLAKTQRPDLIISDIKMPGIDGYELIRAIRTMPELSGTPAIALTGFGAKADIDRAIAAGFDACVSKPAETEEIVTWIEKFAEKRGDLQTDKHSGQ